MLEYVTVELDDDQKRQTDPLGRDGEGSLDPKSPKPLRREHTIEEDGSWVSTPPVDWTTRPVGAGKQEEEEPKRRRRSIPAVIIRDVFIPLIIAVVLVFGGLATIAKPYQIPTGSMEPTIQVNDRIIANRVIYHFKDIERGDIIVFNPPEAAGLDTDTPYVKRVVGLPGDTVAVEDGKTYVNGEEFVVEQIKDPPFYTYREQTVPGGMLFVLGDNRNSSMDSTRWGFLPVENVIGRADVIYWPISSFDWLG